MSFSDIPAAAIAAWASLVTAVSTPFLAVFMYMTGRKVEKIGEQTDGMSKALVEAAGKAGHAKGVAQATDAAEAKATALDEGRTEGRAQGRVEAADAEYYRHRHDELRKAHDDREKK